MRGLLGNWLSYCNGELMGDPDPEKSKRVTDAMLKMKRSSLQICRRRMAVKFGQFLS